MPDDAPTPRQRLPNRRENETVDLVFDGHRYHGTVGFALDGRPREVFCHGGKVGNSSNLDRVGEAIAAAARRDLDLS